MRRVFRIEWGLIGVACAAWMLAALALAISTTDTASFIAIVAATITAACFVTRARTVIRRAFVHGYHTGYHEAQQMSCISPACTSYELAERRARSLT